MRKLVWRHTANRIVNHTGSKPSEDTTGATSGNIISVNSIQSRKKPRRKVNSRIVMMIPTGPNGNPSNVLSMSSSPPRPLRTSEKAVAPIRMAKMKAVVRVVSLTTSVKTDFERVPLASARISAPAAPTPAASVGVAKPRKILPRTAKMRNAGGTTALINVSNAAASKTLSVEIDGKSAGFINPWNKR